MISFLKKGFSTRLQIKFNIRSVRYLTTDSSITEIRTYIKSKGLNVTTSGKGKTKQQIIQEIINKKQSYNCNYEQTLNHEGEGVPYGSRFYTDEFGDVWDKKNMRLVENFSEISRCELTHEDMLRMDDRFAWDDEDPDINNPWNWEGDDMCGFR
eukprot:130780_1